MNLQPRIENLAEKKLIGKRLSMSLATNKTFDLWQSFMPHRREITNRLNEDMISMQVYPESMSPGNLDQIFEKWAAVEVADLDFIPEGMESFILQEGQYAVFDYKGLSTDPAIFRYIFSQWLPQSAYQLDHRPHFEVLGAKYKNGDPASEEEIWIPVRRRGD